MKKPFSVSISKQNLIDAAKEGILSNKQADLLWERFLTKKNSLLSFIYYFGASLILIAMSWCILLQWDLGHSLESFILSVLYSAIFYSSGHVLWKKKALRLPAGLLITLSAGMIPLAIYSLQNLLIFPNNWIVIEITTAIYSLSLLRFFPISFLALPIGWSLWHLSIDIGCLLYQNKNIISLFFGLSMLGFSYYFDLKHKKDYAFWGYLFGCLTFFGELFFLNFSHSIHNLIYIGIHLAAMLFGVFIQRKTILVFGSLGLFSYLTYLGENLLSHQFSLPIVLSTIGITLIGIGVWCQIRRKPKNHVI